MHAESRHKKMTKMAQCFWLVLALCVSGVLGVQVMDDPIAFKNATWAKCQKQEHVPDGAMKDLYYFKSVEGVKDYKCVTKCIHEEYGIVRKDGTLNKMMIVKAIKGFWNDPQLQQRIINAIDAECINEDSFNSRSDTCQNTYELLQCSFEVLDKLGITV